MSEKWDEKDKKHNKTESKQVVEKKTNKLIMPVEDYANILTDAQRAAIREQRISRFPNLFDIRGFEEDVISKHPFVEMSNEVRLYTSLFEEDFKAKIRKSQQKKVNH